MLFNFDPVFNDHLSITTLLSWQNEGRYTQVLLYNIEFVRVPIFADVA